MVRRRRAGFTLVEVIVVLVILAILAAIAIPALTGYIDKAKWKGLVMQSKTQMTAIQTMLNEQYAEEGGFTTHTAITDGTPAASNNNFVTVSGTPDQGYTFVKLTSPCGIQEYRKLTADNQTLTYAMSSGTHYPIVWADRSGAIRVYQYVQDGNFGADSALITTYIRDIESNDTATVKFFEASLGYYSGLADRMKSGWNIYNVNWVNKTYEVYDY
jgi:prepilin-type N-terminal cleavage/methylation domain-containing protein